jgi:hypothetical protein
MEIKRTEQAGVPARSGMISWAQFVEMTEMHPSLVGELIELGWFEPSVTSEEVYLFRLRDVYRARKFERISKEFELTHTGGMLVVDLMDRIERLERKIVELERLLHV